MTLPMRKVEFNGQRRSIVEPISMGIAPFKAVWLSPSS
jgi:hypothetical protein